MDFLIIASFFFTSLALGSASVWFIAKKNKEHGIIGIDINKKDQGMIPESTGIALLVPLWVCTLAFYALTLNTAVLCWALMVSIFALLGLFDDIKPKFLSKTRKWRYRALLVGIASLGFSALFFHEPASIFLGALFLAGIASFENTFAGLNGWEVGSGFILSVFFSLLLLNTPFFLLAIALSGSILALLLFNVFPARVFPGDSGTLLIGSSLAGLLILNGSITLMSIAFLFFIPHMVDFAAKMATNPRDPSQRKTRPYRLLKDGRIALPDNTGKYDFAKLLIRLLGPMKEKKLVLLVWLTVIANCTLWFILL